MSHVKRAVLYLRLSSIVDDSTAIVRQESDLRELAKREGWSVELVLTDDGISGRKARANAAEALRMLREDEADVLAVWKLDRWTRQGLGAIGDLSDTLEAVPGALFVALQDGLRSDQSSWRMIAAVLSEIARSEADNTAARARSAMTYRKTVSGRFTGHGSVPFGYDSVPAEDGVGRVLAVNPSEALVVREVADRILGGASLYSIAKDLNERAVPTSKSEYRKARYRGAPDESADRGRWTGTAIRALWSSHTLQGRVMNRGELVRDENGLPRTVWTPLLDLATAERLREAIGYRREKTPRTRAARLLSGLAFCAYCGGRMYVTSSNGHAIYTCPASWNGVECESPTINAENLERLVVDQWLHTWGHFPEYLPTLTVGDPEALAELAEVEAALREASAGLLDDSADTVALVQRIGALKARRTELREVPTTKVETLEPTGRTLGQAWHAAETPEERRKVLSKGLDHLTVTKGTPGRKGVDPSRVTFYNNPGVDEYLAA